MQTESLFEGRGTLHFIGRSSLVLLVALTVLGQDSCRNQTPLTGIVGNTACLACHDGRSASDHREFRDSPHAGLRCEDCHGPGIDHVRSGGRAGLFIDNPGRAPFALLHESCDDCHAKASPHEAQVEGYLDTVHFASGAITCLDCHDVHKQGAMIFSSESPAMFGNENFAMLCGQCHEEQVDQFLESGHAKADVASCASCHNMHTGDMFRGNPINNQNCLQCHASSLLGFETANDVDFHTGDFHPVDPEGTGASRCVTCHLPPVSQVGQPDVAHDHTLFTVPPLASNDAASMGLAVPPNSCAGIMGCHDPAVPGSGTPYNVNTPSDNQTLQEFYDLIGELP